MLIDLIISFKFVIGGVFVFLIGAYARWEQLPHAFTVIAAICISAVTMFIVDLAAALIKGGAI